MASNSVADAIEAELRANWTTTAIFTADEIDQPPEPPVPFVVLEFPGGAARRYTIGDPGNNVWLEEGAFMVHVLVPIGGYANETTGKLARDYAETIAQLFRGKTFVTSLITYAPNPPQESARADGNYWGVSFGTPYRFQYLA